MKIIDLDQTIYTIVKENPEIEGILFELGFTDIIKPGMMMTVGRFMSIKQGSQLKKIPLDNIKEMLIQRGYTFKEDLV